MSIIEVANLTKYYGKARGIVDVSVNVEEGEVFGFIGPNGAGKSTTIRLLLSLIHPSSGSAKIFGKDVVTQGPEIRRDIGYLPSEVYYYEGMKVIDLLKYSASFYDGDRTQRLQELAMEIQGPYSQIMKGSPWPVAEGLWQHAFLRSRANSIEGGTTEIQRNIIGERVLGLPKG